MARKNERLHSENGMMGASDLNKTKQKYASLSVGLKCKQPCSHILLVVDVMSRPMTIKTLSLRLTLPAYRVFLSCHVALSSRSYTHHEFEHRNSSDIRGWRSKVRIMMQSKSHIRDNCIYGLRKSKRTTPEKFESGPPNAHDLHDPKYVIPYSRDTLANVGKEINAV